MERQDAVHRAQADGFVRHSEYNAALLILGDGARAGAFHFEQSLGAVGAHAAEQRADRVRAPGFGDGFEQDIDRGPPIANPRSVLDRDTVLAAWLASCGNCRARLAPGLA